MSSQRIPDDLHIIKRRALLGGLVAFGPLGSLVGCGGGGGGGGGGEATSAPALIAPLAGKPLARALSYAGDSPDPTFTILGTKGVDVDAAPDRLDKGALCHRFNGVSSRAVVDGLPDFAAADFAVSFWQRSTTATAMRVLSIGGTDGGSSLAIEFNTAQAVVVFWNDEPQPILGSGFAGELADGGWHHVLVQRLGATVQLFVDGALRAAGSAPDALKASTSLRLGAPPWQGDLDDVCLHNRAFGADRMPHMVYAWRPVKAANNPNYLVAYFPFHGNALNDTGRGFDGVAHGVMPAADRYAHAADAYAFNGTDSFIELNESLDTLTADFAIGFWHKASASRPMAALSVSPGARTLDFVFNDGAALSVVVAGIAPLRLSFGNTGELTDDAWHFVLAQRRGNTFEVYVDGTLRASAANEFAFFDGNSLFRFGQSSALSSIAPGFWQGLLDDVQIWVCSFTAQEIEDLKGMQFRSRDGAGAVTFNDRLWMLGGWNPQDRVSTQSEVWSSADGTDWSLATTAPWEGRHMAGWLAFDGRLWVVGGDKNLGHYQNDVWSSPDGVHWDRVTDTPPWAGRATHQTAVFNDRMWLLGGQTLFEGPGQAVAYNDVYSSADGANWRLETAHAGWSPRGLMIGSAVHRGRLWIIGGGTYDIRTFNNDVWSSVDGVHWDRVLEHAPWAARTYHNVTVFDGKLWVIAGDTGDGRGGSDDVWYSADGLIWTQLSGTPWAVRHAASAFVRRNSLWLAAGSSTRLYNDVWTLGYAS